MTKVSILNVFSLPIGGMHKGLGNGELEDQRVRWLEDWSSII